MRMRILDVAANADIATVTQGVSLADGGGLLKVKVDMSPEIQLDKAGLDQPLRLLWFMLLMILVPVAFILDRWLRLPLVKLSSAAKAMTNGDYTAALPPIGGDEIGVLVKQFDEMRNVIGRKEQALNQEIKDRQSAEISLARDYELQKAIGAVLRISMESVSLEEMLEKILDVVLGLSWLAGESKGAIFTIDESSSGLVMKAQRNMPDILMARCKKVALCQCLCGQAAAERRVVFSDHVDAAS